MFARKKPDVLVVGAGPVGLFTALALTKRGVRVRVLDREPRAVTHSYALALHAGSLRLLEEVGILGAVLEKAYRVRRVGIYDRGARKAELRIADLPEDHSFLAVLPQDALEDTLMRTLASRGVKVDWSHAVSQLQPRADHVGVTIDRLSLDTLGYTVQHSEWVVAKSKEHQLPYVVGADGHASTVRRCLGIDFPAVGDPTDFVVFEFKTDTDLGDEMRLCLDEQTTNLCWPLPGGFCRWSFELPMTEEYWDSREKDRDLIQIGAEENPQLTEERLHSLLTERAPWFQGKVLGIRWRMAVRFPRRLAESFGEGRVWLLGDAAHLTGPAGIQSMNIGFREAAELADALAAALADGDATEQFRHYAQTHAAEWRGLLGLEPMLQATDKTPPWLAAAKDRLLSCIPASGQDLVRLAGQLGFQCRLPGTVDARTS